MVGLFLLISFAVSLVDSESEETRPVTFPTPLEELDRIQQSVPLLCEAKGSRGFQEAREMYRQCLLDSKIVKAEENLGGGDITIGKLNCKHQVERKACWKPITQQIEACIPGRGETVARIYSQFLETTCNHEDEWKTLGVSSKLCSVQATISKSCKDHELMTSPDLCTSFRSQKRCEEGDLASCNHSTHKELLQKHFSEIGKSLGCKSDEDASDSVPKSLGSRLVPLPFILLIAKILI